MKLKGDICEVLKRHEEIIDFKPFYEQYDEKRRKRLLA